MCARDVVDLAAHDEVVRDGPAVPGEGFSVGELLFREERSDGVEEFAEGHAGGFGREDAKDGVAHEGVVAGGCLGHGTGLSGVVGRAFWDHRARW